MKSNYHKDDKMNLFLLYLVSFLLLCVSVITLNGEETRTNTPVEVALVGDDYQDLDVIEEDQEEEEEYEDLVDEPLFIR